MSELEQAVTSAKELYSEALQNLERISDEIHLRRGDISSETIGTRGSGVGAESPSPPPLESSPEEPTEQELAEERKRTIEAWLQEAFGKCRPEFLSDKKQSPSGINASTRDETPGDEASSSLATFPPPTESEFSITLNAEVMETLQRTKGIQWLKLPPRSLSARKSTDNLLDAEELSDSESLTGSMSVLDDEQVESIMKEMWDMEQVMAWLNKSEKFQNSPKPIKLTYLEDYIQECEARSGTSSSSMEDHLSLAGGKHNPSITSSSVEHIVFRWGDNKQYATIVRVDAEGNKLERKGSWALVTIPDEKESGASEDDEVEREKKDTKEKNDTGIPSHKPEIDWDDDNSDQSHAVEKDEKNQTLPKTDGQQKDKSRNKGYILQQILSAEGLDVAFSSMKPNGGQRKDSSTEVLAPSITSSRNTYIGSSPHSSSSESSGKPCGGCQPKVPPKPGILPKFSDQPLLQVQSDIPQFLSAGFKMKTENPKLLAKDYKREEFARMQAWSNNFEQTIPRMQVNESLERLKSSSTDDDDIVICVQSKSTRSNTPSSVSHESKSESKEPGNTVSESNNGASKHYKSESGDATRKVHTVSDTDLIQSKSNITERSGSKSDTALATVQSESPQKQSKNTKDPSKSIEEHPKSIKQPGNTTAQVMNIQQTESPKALCGSPNSASPSGNSNQPESLKEQSKSTQPIASTLQTQTVKTSERTKAESESTKPHSESAEQHSESSKPQMESGTAQTRISGLQPKNTNEQPQSSKQSESPKQKAGSSRQARSPDTKSPSGRDDTLGNANAVKWEMCKTTPKKPLGDCSNSGSSASEWGSKEDPELESEESDVDGYFTTRL